MYPNIGRIQCAAALPQLCFIFRILDMVHPASLPLQQLRNILEEAFEQASEGAVYVVDEKHRKTAMGNAGWQNCNLRTTFTKIVKRAGLTTWPRLFHNLRNSRQTELAERFPSHVVCDWLGNSEDIARKHYYQTTDAHFADASASPTECGAESGARGAQNATQRVRAANRGDSQKESQLIAAK